MLTLLQVKEGNTNIIWRTENTEDILSPQTSCRSHFFLTQSELRPGESFHTHVTYVEDDGARRV